MNSKLATRLLLLCITATVISCAVQYLLERRIESDVFTYLIPGCVVSYWIGRRDGLRERDSGEAHEAGNSLARPPKGGGPL
jgi:hypothetical protein